jgi:hypothetical protein
LGKLNLPPFLRDIIEKLERNNAVRFILFMEDFPKHRIIEDINIGLVALLSIACLAAGIGGFTLWGYFGLIGFVLYYVVLSLTLLETAHCLFDR